MDFKEFSELLYRYKRGEATEQEQELVEHWYDLLDEERTFPVISGEDELKNRIWQRVISETNFDKDSRSLRNVVFKIRPSFIKMFAAASVAVILMLWIGISYWQNNSNKSYVTKTQESEYKIYSNNSDTSLVVQLPDLSKVTLEPSATIRVRFSKSRSKREVYLSGEAFFDVTKNVNQPFYVYAGSITTHVLGTSFRIRPLSNNGEVMVSVKTGRVEVFETINSSGTGKVKVNTGVVLTPNQLAVYHADKGVFEASIIDSPQPLTVEDAKSGNMPKFSFTETPLIEILKLLEVTYGIEIMVEKASLNNCPFSGDLSEQSLFEKLEVINKALGTDYEIKGTCILIKGNGCD